MQIAITKIGRMIDVDLASIGIVESELSAPATYVVKYGLTQSINDSHAAEKYDGESVTQADNIEAICRKKVDAILSGTIAMRGVGAPRDPVGSLVHRFAADEIRTALRKAGKKPSEMAKDVFEAGVQKHIDKNRDRLVAAANEWIATKANVAVDLTEIGL